jgi:hypothetical protein
MLKFKDFIVENGHNVPVVSLSKDEVDLNKAETRNEINRNLAAGLSRHWMNPYGGWVKAGKILSMYNIFLPKVTFNNDEEGEEVVAINQFGDKFGANLDGTVTTDADPDMDGIYFYYSYGIGDSGFYETYAVVTDENGINDLISDDEDLDDADNDLEYIGTQGELDPRQE